MRVTDPARGRPRAASFAIAAIVCGIIAAVGCARTHPAGPEAVVDGEAVVTRDDPRWRIESAPLEIAFQWIGRREGRRYRLDERLTALALRYVRPRQGWDPGALRGWLQRAFALSFDQRPDGAVVVHGRADDAFYRRFTWPEAAPDRGAASSGADPVPPRIRP